MKNWMKFTDKESDQIWDRVYSDFEFSPSISIFPSFKVPSPFVTYDISHYFGESIYLNVYDDLEEKALLVFKENTAANEYIMVLDWQHECYWVNPHIELKEMNLMSGQSRFFQMEITISLFKRTISGGI